MAAVTSLKKKNKKKRKGRIPKFFISVLLLAVISAAAAVLITNDGKLNAEGFLRLVGLASNGTEASVFSFDAGSGIDFADIDGGLAVCTTTGLQVYDKSAQLCYQETFELEARRIMLSHGFVSTTLDAARMIFPEFFERIRAEGVDMFVFGHTHMPYSRTLDSTLYFNPGYAGPDRELRPAHVGMLEIDGADIRAWHVAL